MMPSSIKALVCLLLCTLASAAIAQDVIRLGTLRLAHFGAVAYIKEIAPSCGIKVEETVFAKGIDVMQAIMAGDLDVGATAAEAAIAGRASGAPIYVVAGFARGGARLVARRGLDVADIKDLKGKRVGVTRGAIQEVLLLAKLQQHGLSADTVPGKDVTIVYMSYSDLNQALLAGRIDVMMQSEPQSSQAINAGFGVQVLKPYDTAIGEPVRTLVMTETLYRDRPAVAARFMECFVKATQQFIREPALAEKYVRDVVFQGQLTRADFRDAIANSPYTFDIDAAHIQITTDTMMKTGVGRMTAAPVANQWVKTDLLRTAKAALGVDDAQRKRPVQRFER